MNTTVSRAGAGHTPGPWTFLPSQPKEVRLKRDHWTVGSVNGLKGVGIVFGDNEANARLIAAAPDMLDMLRKLQGECAECGGTGEHQVGTDRIDGDTIPVMESCPDCADIRAVIEKAVGQ